MVKTLSRMIPLGTIAPEFELLEPGSGEIKGLNELRGSSATVIMFICNHCPFVKHITSELTSLANDYLSKGIAFIAINSNDVDNYPDDSPENMVKEAKANGYLFPYLFDETQQVAKAYHAVCTPDFFVFDANLACVYRGQLDDSRPGNDIAVSGSDLRAALNAVISGNSVSDVQKPSVGCNIKWKNS
ncbi:MAG: thioredoxin family protein [Gammaproteobacteria bacterium]|nr:thioredoxin family protein [Gammaproteobacteria bacterium]